MFIIEKGKAYIVKGDKAIEIAFNDKNLVYKETDKEIEVSNQRKYTFNEVIAKLNIRNNIAKAKAKKTAVASDSELQKVVDKLTKENEALKAEIVEKDNEIATLKAELEKAPEENDGTKKGDDASAQIPEEEQK